MTPDDLLFARRPTERRVRLIRSRTTCTPTGWASWCSGTRCWTWSAGHKKPQSSDEDVAGILDGTRRYIRDFADSVTAATRAREVVAAMQAKYPDHGNLTTLVFSAAAVMEAKG